MKICSYNVNGLNAMSQKGGIDYVKKELPDVLCIQETKANPEDVEKWKGM